MNECALCNWPEEELIATNDLAKAFFVREPVRTGHMAVATRAHQPTLRDSSPEEAGAVMRLAQALALAATPILGVEKFYLAGVGDVDKHFHIHLLPKKEDEPKMGRHIFSADGWQGGPPAPRDAQIEGRIAAALKSGGAAATRESRETTRPEAAEAAAPHKLQYIDRMAAEAADSASIEKIIAANYATISFREGEDPDWSRDTDLYAPGARLMRRTRTGLTVMDPAEYRRNFELIRREEKWKSFWEGQTSAGIEIHGNVAQVASHYEARRTKEDPELLGSGVNLIQLVRLDGAWKIVSILWDSWRE